MRVSTHSRLKAAGIWVSRPSNSKTVSTHSRLKAAGARLCHAAVYLCHVSTHSRLKAAGHFITDERGKLIVSTHSRLKAAGFIFDFTHFEKSCFNTQPPEGGWVVYYGYNVAHSGFNTQPPEGGWCIICRIKPENRSFNTQPPEGGWKVTGKGLVSDTVSTHSRLKAAGL